MYPDGRYPQHCPKGQFPPEIRLFPACYTRAMIIVIPDDCHGVVSRSTRHIDVAACTARGIAVAAGTQASPHPAAAATTVWCWFDG
jgi:hypothetical protein